MGSADCVHAMLATQTIRGETRKVCVNCGTQMATGRCGVCGKPIDALPHTKAQACDARAYA